jgi:hypothetical protein
VRKEGGQGREGHGSVLNREQCVSWDMEGGALWVHLRTNLQSGHHCTCLAILFVLYWTGMMKCLREGGRRVFGTTATSRATGPVVAQTRIAQCGSFLKLVSMGCTDVCRCVCVCVRGCVCVCVCV